MDFTTASSYNCLTLEITHKFIRLHSILDITYEIYLDAVSKNIVHLELKKI
ncbi:5320_t:CDS:2 [Diversispora eburnea]|uniref:5320_t:CDS:1 n=1 Tax=Diversispora eburnea TaxID=1213867 RepID=A0A9N8ZZR2_9GLOM|nr:5320_t:CDS:2 [Diversispora eburnea]